MPYRLAAVLLLLLSIDCAFGFRKVCPQVPKAPLSQQDNNHKVVTFSPHEILSPFVTAASLFFGLGPAVADIGAHSNNDLKSSIEMSLIDDTSYEVLKKVFFSYPENAPFLALCFGIFLSAAERGSRKDLEYLLGEIAMERESLTETNSKALEIIEEEKQKFSSLQRDTKNLLGEIDSLSHQLTSKSQEVESLMTSIVEMKTAAEATATNNPSMPIIMNLKEEVALWKAKAHSITADKTALAADTTLPPHIVQALEARKPREDVLVGAVSKFLTRTKLVPVEVSSAIDLTNTASILDGILEMSLPPAEVKRVEVKDSHLLEEKVDELTKQVAGLTGENSKLQESINSMSDELASTLAKTKAAKEAAVKEKKVVLPAVSADSPALSGVLQENKALKLDMAKSAKAASSIKDEMISKLDAATMMAETIKAQLSDKEIAMAAKEADLKNALKAAEAQNGDLKRSVEQAKKELLAIVVPAPMQEVVDPSEAVEGVEEEESVSVDNLVESEVKKPVKEKNLSKKAAVESDLPAIVTKADAIATLSAMKPYQIKTLSKKALVEFLTSLEVLDTIGDHGNMKKRDLLGMLDSTLTTI